MTATQFLRKRVSDLKASWPIPRPAAESRTINLALQGGGAHGAFTWGVLDRLLEDGRFRFDMVSGASAGGVNGVALAAGLADGGGDAARALLQTVWRDISDAAPSAGDAFRFGSGPFGKAQQSAQEWSLGLLTRFFSPYQFNPLNLNPLRDILIRRIDFERLNAHPAVSLLIAATDVQSGRATFFENGEITVDTLLASCCLPQIFQAVRIDDRVFWDGGYSANPPVLPIIRQASSDDTLIVQITREYQTEPPRQPSEIMERLQQMAFSQPLRLEMDRIAELRRLARRGISVGGRERRRIKRHRLHCIDSADATGELPAASKLAPEWDMLQNLRDHGRRAAERWTAANFDQIGRRSTVDLAAGIG